MGRSNSIMHMANKIPVEYFYTKGKGESDYGGKGLPFEAGSYDAALNMAKIQNSNIMMYTSLIPPGAKEIKRDDGVKKQQWGQVMDCIMAKMNGVKGETITAAVLTTKIYDKGGKYMGTFACEYAGYGSKKNAEETLLADVSEMVERRGWGKAVEDVKLYKTSKTNKGNSFEPARLHVDSMKIKKKYGTVLSSICFTEYHYPIVSEKTAHNINNNKSKSKSRSKKGGKKNGKK